jgi:hypothetical protein
MRRPLATRVARIAVPAALVGIVTTGVILAASPTQTQVAYPASVANVVAPSASSTTTAAANRHQAGSRGVTSARPSMTEPPPSKVAPAPKPALKATLPDPIPDLKVVGKKYAKIDLNVRVDPEQKADVVGVVKSGGQISVTSAVRDGYRYISYKGKGGWVKNQYLVSKKPAAAATGGVSTAPCKSGTKMESGLTPDAIKVHRTLCARYPQVTSFGGTRGGGGNHGSGRAVDCMISNAAVGQQMANWVRAHAKQLGVSEVIYRQHIWTVQRSSEGWRGMSDRGSATANHYDHVHVSVYGNRARG